MLLLRNTSIPCVALYLLGSFQPALAQSTWKELDAKGRRAFDASEFQKACNVFSKAVKQAEKEFGPRDQHVAISLINLAESHRRVGNADEAEKEYNKGIAILEGTVGPEHLAVGRALARLGEFYVFRFEYNSRALVGAAMTHGAPVRPGGLTTGDPRVAAQQPRIPVPEPGSELQPDYFQPKLHKARPVLRRALAILEKHLGPNHSELVPVLHSLAIVEFLDKQYGPAESYMLRATSNALLDPGTDNATRAILFTETAKCSAAAGKHGDADTYYREAVRLLENSERLGATHLPNVLQEWSDTLRAAGRPEEAEKVLQQIPGAKARAKELAAQNPPKK